MTLSTDTTPTLTPNTRPGQEREGLGLSPEQQWQLIDAARDCSPVGGLTHNYYRYPARFPPQMVRAVIEAFTEPGDLVLDPYSGGGTTLVESLASGRSAIGIDISTLASFVARVKTTLLNDAALQEVRAWAARAAREIRMDRPEPTFSEWADAGYFKHLGQKRYWRLRKALAQSVALAGDCTSPEVEAFCRCLVLKTAQWALDGRRSIPSVADFRKALLAGCDEMVMGMRQLAAQASSNGNCQVRSLHRSAVGIETDPAVSGRKPRLVMTSPPYPGVHVLYHRWQIGGGKETGTPFWIANKLDGAGGAYYTMGDRKSASLDTYFQTIEASLTSVAAVCALDAVIVQVVAFSQPEWQLAKYLEAAAKAGLSELRLPVLEETSDGRLWRRVPNRRWYADQKGATAGSNEVMLFHQLADPQVT